MNTSFNSQSFSRAVLLSLLTAFCFAALSHTAFAHGPTPPSLKGVKVPKVPGLVDGTNPIVINKTAAVALGKALFWDVNVGSDGMACASCHFHAGADGRVKNQLAPGLLRTNAATAKTFEKMASGALGRPNYTLKSSDFPFYQLANPRDKHSAILYRTDDVAGSSGSFLAQFDSVALTGKSRDNCTSVADDIFHIGQLNTRRLEPRNTPTVINAAFNFRNFWDGRANNIFNGVSAFGLRDKKAGIWIVQTDGTVQKRKIALRNSSLASQAVVPPLSNEEMSCSERTLPELGRKLLARRPLAAQDVHPQDSVLAALRHDTGKGLNTTYRALIRQAFAPRYWAGKGQFGTAQTGTNAYNQMEANFSFFFGLALQLYQDTLISDQSPFDTPRNAADIPTGLTAQQARGLTVFKEAHCLTCHKGPTLSAAAHPAIYSVPSDTGLPLVNRKTLKGSATGSGVAFALMDEGFVNTSVTPAGYDIGIGGKDPFGNPLSFSVQYVQFLKGRTTVLPDKIAIKSCAFDVPFFFDHNIGTELRKDPFGIAGCGAREEYGQVPTAAAISAEQTKLEQGRMLVATQGAFKIPTLRNVELTGPYMHNGSMKTLEEVVEFYNRGGNLDNPHHFATLTFPQGLTQTQKTDLVAFLKSLTDERVRWERAPFDHPALLVPHGHRLEVSAKNPNQWQDEFLAVKAVGRYGRSTAMGPVKPFHNLLQP
jgi:cytochrome c peroxidase